MLSTMSAVARPPAPTPTVRARCWRGDEAVVSVMGLSLRSAPRSYAVWPLPGARPVGQSVGVTDLFDLRDPGFVTEPYAALAAARRQAPVLWHEGLGLWVTTTHAAANDVLRDRRLGRILRPRSLGDEAWTTFDWLHADSILDSEPPKHTRLRRLVAGAFARGHVARLRPRVEEIAAGLLDEVVRAWTATGGSTSSPPMRSRCPCSSSASCSAPRPRTGRCSGTGPRPSSGCTRWTRTRSATGRPACVRRVRLLRRGARGRTGGRPR